MNKGKSLVLKLAVLGVFLSVLISCDNSSDESKSIIQNVDHIMLISENAEEVKNFMDDVLKLPESWPYTYMNGFSTGGVFAGNVRLEAADNLTYLGGNTISGFAFEPDCSGNEVIEEMNKRGIENSILETHENYRTIDVTDILPNSWIFFCEFFTNKEKRQAKWDKDKALFDQQQGGPLGIEYVSEITIFVKDDANINIWEKLLSPVKKEKGNLFKLKKGLSIRLTISEADYISSIRFKVKSIDAARDYLKNENILGKDESGVVGTDPDITHGILFEFKE